MDGWRHVCTVCKNISGAISYYMSNIILYERLLIRLHMPWAANERGVAANATRTHMCAKQAQLGNSKAGTSFYNLAAFDTNQITTIIVDHCCLHCVHLAI